MVLSATGRNAPCFLLQCTLSGVPPAAEQGVRWAVGFASPEMTEDLDAGLTARDLEEPSSKRAVSEASEIEMAERAEARETV